MRRFHVCGGPLHASSYNFVHYLLQCMHAQFAAPAAIQDPSGELVKGYLPVVL